MKPRDVEPDLASAIEETREVLKAASRLYAPFSCPGSAECCHLAVTTRPPWLWPTEWEVLRPAVLAANGGQLPPPRAAGGCRLLDAAGLRCTVYEARPFGCRTFFCDKRVGPAREPTAKTHALLDELTAINVALDPGSAPLTIDDWFSPSARSPAAP